MEDEINDYIYAITFIVFIFNDLWPKSKSNEYKRYFNISDKQNFSNIFLYSKFRIFLSQSTNPLLISLSFLHTLKIINVFIMPDRSELENHLSKRWDTHYRVFSKSNEIVPPQDSIWPYNFKTVSLKVSDDQLPSKNDRKRTISAIFEKKTVLEIGL